MQSSGLQLIDLPQGWVQHGYAYGISNNVIIGSAYNIKENRTEAFRSKGLEWTGLGVLGNLPQPISEAEVVSGDGSTIAGYTSSPTGMQIFRWDAKNGMVDIGNITGPSITAHVGGITYDGNMIVGWVEYPGGHDHEPFIWKSSEDIEPISLPSRFSSARYTDVSADGSTILGYGRIQDKIKSFRITNGGIKILSAPFPATDIKARRITLDGRYAVGSYLDASETTRAFRVEENNTIVDIQNLLEQSGVDLSGWNLEEATDLSDDGMTVVGWGTNSANDPPSAKEGWIAFLSQQ